jgi:hypothetical protein
VEFALELVLLASDEGKHVSWISLGGPGVPDGGEVEAGGSVGVILVHYYIRSAVAAISALGFLELQTLRAVDLGVGTAVQSERQQTERHHTRQRAPHPRQFPSSPPFNRSSRVLAVLASGPLPEEAIVFLEDEVVGLLQDAGGELQLQLGLVDSESGGCGLHYYKGV